MLFCERTLFGGCEEFIHLHHQGSEGRREKNTKISLADVFFHDRTQFFHGLMESTHSHWVTFSNISSKFTQQVLLLCLF